jgi:hypothetical protein
MAVVFFSYSHKDEELRDELEIHLSALKRQGVIETWHDRRIIAGEPFDHSISQHLEEADIILLLISPYFVASDYCYDIEMKRALERHQEGTARVIPVILHPCDWQRLPFGKLTATPRDGKPISKFPNEHDAFLDVTTTIRAAAETVNARSPTPTTAAPRSTAKERLTVPPRPRSSNLRIKKKFTDHDKHRFKTESFEYIANFFEGSLEELRTRNRDIETEFRRIDANQFTAAIYSGGSEISRCRVSLADERSMFGGILYAAGAGGGGAFNESLSVDDDGYNMHLKALGLASWGTRRDEKLAPEGAAEFYWGMLIQPLQR